MVLFLNPQEVEFLSALNQYQARYIVIGGHAVQFHGHLRTAKDLDIWVEPTPENAKRIANALALVGTFLNQEQINRLAKPDLQMRIVGLYTEIITTMQGLEFAETIARSVTATEQGVPCHVLSLQDLIMNKHLLGRKSDIEDITNLEKLNR